MAATPIDWYVRNEIVSHADVSAVREIGRLAGSATPLPVAVELALALATGAGRDGDTCVDFGRLDRVPPSATVSWPAAGKEWERVLREHPGLVSVVGDKAGERGAPFVLDGSRLYVARVHHEESSVEQWLRNMRNGRLKVVLGGPGSGKTTFIAKELVKRFSEGSGAELKVDLVAPTGKAARRMRQSLMRALDREKVEEHVRARIIAASSARTVHKLLGYSPGRTPRYRVNGASPIDADIVIVDEASMMSLSLMYHLLDAINPADPAKAESVNETVLWLVGDPDQLASVDAGTVLGDIRTAVLQDRSKWDFAPQEEQHRFKDQPNIVRLVDAVRKAGDETAVDGIIRDLSTVTDDLEWVDPRRNIERVNAIAADVVATARALAAAATNGEKEEALAILGSLQVLCAHRAGDFGVAGWNQRIQSRVHMKKSEVFYPGRPIMVTHNDDQLGVSNGDVGVVCTVDGRNVAVFEGFDGPFAVPTSRLPGIETVHALTIHKSQGSEYEHAIVVLPVNASRILTRELLYTGISRPTKKLTVIATEESLRKAILNPIRRATGLAERLSK